jgi:hypothetical protein
MSSADPLRSVPNRMALTPEQRRMLRHAFESGAALRAQSDRAAAAFGQRQAIRELCLSCGQQGQSPEELLIAFKTALIETANDDGMAYGPERSELLSRLVSLFIEELYEFPVQRVTGEGDGAASRGM